MKSARPPGLTPPALRIVDDLLTAAPQAAAVTKALVAEAVEAPDTPAFRKRIANEAADHRRLPEATEGLASFAEKRPPAWYPDPG